MSVHHIKKISGVSSLFLFLITVSIAFIILFTPLYYFSAWSLDLPEQLGMSMETLMENYHVLLRYLHFPWITELNFPDFTSSASGLFHFYEVKLLFYLNYFILIASFIGSVFYMKSLKKNKRLWTLQKPFFIAALVPPILLTFLAVSFDRMFVLFHEIFFNNDDWLFDPATDPIILALPQEFFMYTFLLFFLLIEMFFIIAYQYSKRNAFK
ncbi:integral membrane protein TIGR01906 [Alkalibacterium subtropicum]|uniref:Integral membrane protein TIGR01906 n=1 Tax=Alkalibacterium subtropicum TaxID=753702 RepID=A0A1I1HHP2_9LACT|nr:TIGR01906 family membrane protein [Alkalibacterium subtropicum]SFC21488.1 integral membrane protein TIGR01906 [Alkalibacterium subtropicum]